MPVPGSALYELGFHFVKHRLLFLTHRFAQHIGIAGAGLLGRLLAWRLAGLGHAYAKSGMRGEAQKILRQLLEHSRQHYVSPYSIALIYVGLGEKEQAFTWLQKAVEARSTRLVRLQVDPRFNTLRADPRFRNLVQQIGLLPGK